MGRVGVVGNFHFKGGILAGLFGLSRLLGRIGNSKWIIIIEKWFGSVSFYDLRYVNVVFAGKDKEFVIIAKRVSCGICRPKWIRIYELRLLCCNEYVEGRLNKNFSPISIVVFKNTAAGLEQLWISYLSI